MNTKTDEEEMKMMDQMEHPVSRYDNKIEEMNTMALITALLFGFSITMWIEFDQTLFSDKNKTGLAYIFSISAMITIITSVLATVIAIGIIVSFRRLQFKFGKETNAESLRIFKRNTHQVRHFVRFFIYAACTGLFVEIGVYSHVKWIDTVKSDFLYILNYLLLLSGWIVMVVVYYSIKNAYNDAVASKQK